MLYSLPLKGKPKMIAVLPKETAAETADNLRSLGLSILYYEHRESNPKFVDLATFMDSILKRL
jgi:hypothetical protein